MIQPALVIFVIDAGMHFNFDDYFFRAILPLKIVWKTWNLSLVSDMFMTHAN